MGSDDDLQIRETDADLLLLSFLIGKDTPATQWEVNLAGMKHLLGKLAI